VAISLAGVQMQRVSPMLIGTMVAGMGFGTAFFGSMRTVVPQAEAYERAGLLSAFYVDGGSEGRHEESALSGNFQQS
jgi:hypothetical protein